MSKEYGRKDMPEPARAEAADFIGPRIKELCDRQLITKYRLSQMTGLTQTVLAKIIRKESIPTIQTLEKICAALGVSLSQFFAKGAVQPDLTAEQTEIVETWNGLRPEERERLMKIVRTFQ